MLDTLKSRETLVWLALMSFTLLGFYFADSSPSDKRMMGGLVLLLAGLKFFAISQYFMELSDSHIVWKSIMYPSLLAVLLGIFVQL